MRLHEMLARGPMRHPAAPVSEASAAGAHDAPGVVASGGRNPQQGSHLRTGPGRLADNGGQIDAGRMTREPGVHRRAIDSGLTMGDSRSFDRSFRSRLSGRHTIVVTHPQQGNRTAGSATPFGGTKAPRYSAEIPGVNAGYPAAPIDGCA